MNVSKKATEAKARKALAGRPPWWKLDASSVFAGRTELVWQKDKFSDANCDLWIGDQWDGHSQLDLGVFTMSARTLRSVIAQVRRNIRAQQVKVYRLPTAASIRHCAPYGGIGRDSLVMDIDFGDFILPVAFEESFFWNGSGPSAADACAAITHTIVAAEEVRDQLAQHEQGLRRDLEQVTARAGAIMPIWLRMRPWPAVLGRSYPHRRAYELIALTLDEDLQQEANGSNRIANVSDIEDFVRSLKAQRRRAATRAKLDTASSAGLISDVALALMNLRGYEPREVLTYLRACRGEKRTDGLLHLTHNTRETLTLVEGVVQARIEFADGNYSSGRLTLNGDYPATFAGAAKKRPLTAFVDHPALRAVGATVTEGRWRADALVLRHRVRTVLVEDIVASRSKSPDEVSKARCQTA